VTGLFRAIGDALAGKPEPDPALQPRGCRDCGLTFGNESAFACHQEQLGDGRKRCMPSSRFEGVLRQVDGVWVVSGAT
jgi:hypothetical protein